MKAVIFDVDGTLTDSVHLHAKAWQMAFEHFGHAVPYPSIWSQIGKGGDQLMPIFLSQAELKAKGERIEKYRSELFKREFLPKVKPFPKVRELFECLRNDGWKLALASSAKKQELKVYQDICRVTDLLEADVSSDDADRSKPAPDIFNAALKGLGNPLAQDCFVIGDSPYDAQAAKKARIPSIGFLSGGFSQADLINAGCSSIYWGAPDLLAKYDQSSLSTAQTCAHRVVT